MSQDVCGMAGLGSGPALVAGFVLFTCSYEPRQLLFEAVSAF